MQRNAAPGKPLHVRHRRIVIDVGEVILVLLQDGEHAGGRLVALLAGADRGDAGEHTVAVHVGALLVERNDHEQWAAAGDVAEPDELALLQGREWCVGGTRFLRTPERHLRRPGYAGR